MKALRSILGVALIAAVMYFLWLLIPPYFHNYQLDDVVADEARMNTYTVKSEEDMRQTILKKARDMNLALTPEQVSVQRIGNGVAISVDYTVHVDLPGYPMDLHFHSSSQNRSF